MQSKEKITTLSREISSPEEFQAQIARGAAEAKKAMDDPNLEGFLLVRVLKNGMAEAHCSANPLGVIIIQETVMKWSETSLKTLLKDIILNG